MSDRYERARVEQDPFNYSQAGTSTYYASSVAPSGQGEDKQSVYTYSSMDAHSFVKQVGNRAYNTLSDTYFLPTDDDEWTRLNKQHIAIVIGLGAMYPVPDVVRSILAPKEGETKRILDLGCGTGLWTTEMAKEFPHCEVLGVDLAPVPIDKMDVPPNCNFEIDDINIGLGHFRGQYDFVNARLIGAGLKNFRQTMQHAEECLKPGGIIVWLDGDYDMYAKDRHVYMPFATDEDSSGSWFQRIVYEMRRGAINSGKSDINGMSQALDAGLWEQPLIDPATCSTGSLYLPIGPWPAEEENVSQAQLVRYVGSIMRQDLMSVHRAGHAVVKRSGYSEEMVMEWSRKADEEMMSMSKPMWFRMRLAWGQRREAEGSPAPATTTNKSSSPPSLYPYYYVHTSQEESLQEAALRNRNKDLPEPPLPTQT